MTQTTIQNGWKEITLGEVCEVSSSKRIFAKEYQTSGIPFFRGKEVTEKYNGNKVSTELFITEDKYNEIKNKFGVPQKNDILLTSVGTLGNPYLVEKDFKFYFKDGNLTWFRKYKDIDPKFLFYWIISPQGKESLSHSKIGSTQQAYTIVSLKKSSILLPPLPEQKAIAAVFSSLDDKIELLREQNETLEAIGQSVFQEWFGKYQVGAELPKGWRVGKIGDVVDIKQGKYTKAEDISEIKKGDKIYPVYGGNGIRGYIENFIYKTSQVVLTCRGNGCGRIYFSEKKSSITNSCMAFESENSILSSEFIYFWSKRIDFESVTSGSAQPQITVTNLYGLEIIIPEKNILEKFNQVIKPLFEKIKNNSEQIQTLSKTRDILLPRLMREEIKAKTF
jgi:type I restriction enzyme, S subunit